MYTEISKRKQGSPCKNSHQRCFETTNFDRLHREELLFVPRYTHRLNSFSSTITQQNTHFNMYIETSKQQQGFPCKNSHQKCFKRTNFDRFHREYMNNIYRCERGRVGIVLNSVVFPRRSKLFIFKSIDPPPP